MTREKKDSSAVYFISIPKVDRRAHGDLVLDISPQFVCRTDNLNADLVVRFFTDNFCDHMCAILACFGATAILATLKLENTVKFGGRLRIFLTGACELSVRRQ